MKFFNRIIALTSAILVVATGGAGATAFATDDSTTANATTTPYLQISQVPYTPYSFDKVNNTLQVTYEIQVQAIGGDVENAVVYPAFSETNGETNGELTLEDASAEDGTDVDASLTEDNDEIYIPHLTADVPVTLTITHSADYESLLALERAADLTQFVSVLGYDDEGNANVFGHDGDVGTQCDTDGSLDADTDACEALTIPVPHLRVNALAPQPYNEGYPNEVSIETQVKLENYDSDYAYLAFSPTTGVDLLGYYLKDADGNVLETVKASDDLMDGGRYWIPLKHMEAGVVKTVDLHVAIQEKNAIHYQVNAVLNDLHNNITECKANYSLDSDADGCDFNMGHATLVADDAPEITSNINNELTSLEIPVDVGIDQLTEHADVIDTYIYDVDSTDIPAGAETKNDFTCTSDDLPEGLTVETDLNNEKCVISGTPTKGGEDDYSVNVKFDDGTNYILTGTYTIKETAVPEVAPTTEDKPEAETPLVSQVPDTAPTAEDKPEMPLPLYKVPDTAPTTEDKPEMETPLETQVPDTAPTVDLPADTVVILKDQRLDAQQKCATDSENYDSTECAKLKASIDDLQTKLNKEIHATEIDIDWFCTESAETFDAAKCADAKSLLEHLKEGLLTKVPNDAPTVADKPEGVVPPTPTTPPAPTQPKVKQTKTKTPLADTGSYTGPLAIIGGLVLLAGAGLIFVASKKQKEK